MPSRGPRSTPSRAVRTAAGLLAVAATLAGCRSDTPIVRNVPLIRDAFPAPPFPDGWRVADLTLRLDAAAPHVSHPRQFPFERMELPPAESGGPRTGAFTAMEHMGTHLAAPRTRIDAGATVDQFGGGDLLLPVAVVDVPSDAASEASISVETVRADERTYGDIPKGAAVLLRTRSGLADATHRGWAGPAVRWLVQERGARVIGSDAPTIDSSATPRGPAQGAAAGAGVWSLVSLRGLEALPRRGAYLVIGVLPVAAAAGAPARVVALVPPDAPPPETPEPAPK